MKMTISFTEDQLSDLVETAIKNRFPHENIEFGKRTLKFYPMTSQKPASIQSLEIELDFGNGYNGIYAPGTK
jgi:hypothetical protein